VSFGSAAASEVKVSDSFYMFGYATIGFYYDGAINNRDCTYG
jgi:hypothetical protein